MFSIVTYSWSVYGAERATATDMTTTYGNGYGTLETAADLSAWPAIVTMPRGGCSSPPPGDPLKRPPCVTGVLRLLDVDSRWAVRCVCVCVCVTVGRRSDAVCECMLLIDGDWVVNGRCAAVSELYWQRFECIVYRRNAHRRLPCMWFADRTDTTWSE